MSPSPTAVSAPTDQPAAARARRPRRWPTGRRRRRAGPTRPRVQSSPSSDVHTRASASPLRSSEPTTMKPSSLAAQPKACWLPPPPNEPSSALGPLAVLARSARARRSPPLRPSSPTAMACRWRRRRRGSAGCPHPRPRVLALERLAVGRRDHDGVGVAAHVGQPTAMNPSPIGAAASSEGAPAAGGGRRFRWLAGQDAGDDGCWSGVRVSITSRSSS